MKETTDSQRLTIYYTMLFANVLSILGSLFIIIIFLSFRSLQKFAFTLVFILGILDLFNSIAFAIPTYNSDDSSAECQIQGILLNFFTLIGVLWTAYIAFSLYYILAKNQIFPEKYWKHSLVGLILICILNTMIPIITDTYGTVAGWCWIEQTNELDTGFFERYFLFFIPLWLTVFFIIFLYVKVLKVLRCNYNDECTVKSLNKKLTYYPIILILCFLPYTVKALLELNQIEFVVEYQVAFTIVAGVFRSLNGFLNALVYGNTKKVRGLLRKWKDDEGEEGLKNSMIINCDKKIKESHCTVFSDESLIES